MNKTPLTIVAIIKSTDVGRALVKAELLKLMEPTRKEAGFIQYDLHQDNQDPNTFLFYENWESRELWQAHMQNPFLAGYMKATEGAVVSFTLHEMTRIA